MQQFVFAAGFQGYVNDPGAGRGRGRWMFASIIGTVTSVADGNNKEMRIKIAGKMNKQRGGVIITPAKVVLSIVMNH